jgi:hypothetical protein
MQATYYNYPELPSWMPERLAHSVAVYFAWVADKDQKHSFHFLPDSHLPVLVLVLSSLRHSQSLLY